ncbi:hypothetical protein DL771_008480 [Monosporascus sp. 5C6A]|nr:hypothetical protein DL771_008480 [Monosporascus sp. 5C6A]
MGGPREHDAWPWYCVADQGIPWIRPKPQNPEPESAHERRMSHSTTLSRSASRTENQGNDVDPDGGTVAEPVAIRPLDTVRAHSSVSLRGFGRDNASNSSEKDTPPSIPSLGLWSEDTLSSAAASDLSDDPDDGDRSSATAQDEDAMKGSDGDRDQPDSESDSSSSTGGADIWDQADSPAPIQYHATLINTIFDLLYESWPERSCGGGSGQSSSQSGLPK